MSTRRINDLLNLAHVVHWHTVPTRRKCSVAEHSFRVAAIVLELYDRLRNFSLCPALRLALVHDGPETETGDLPHTTKVLFDGDGARAWRAVESALCPWYANEYEDPGTMECRIVKIADLIECYMFICKEQVDTEGHNAEVGTREQLYRAINEANLGGLDKAVWDIIAESRLPSDTRHAVKNTVSAPCSSSDTTCSPAPTPGSECTGSSEPASPCGPQSDK